MKARSSEKGPQDLWIPNANDRMKARWNAWVARSTMAAAVLHAAVFGLWPNWERSALESDPLEDFLQLEWVSVLGARSIPSINPTPAVRVAELPDSIPVDADLYATASGTGVQVATLSEAFRERLLGRSAPEPSVTELEPEGEPTESFESEGDEDGSIDVNRSVSSADFEELLGSDPLGLDRLSAVRPELVLAAPSAWVLIRNPTEVEQFIRRSYRRGDLDRSVNGSVSVALWIDRRGSVEWAEISRSSGRNDVDQVALALFSEIASFRPARDQGVTIPRSVIFSVRFPW